MAWLGPLLIAAVALAMFCWCWARSPDVIIDFGRELYVAWQLSEGQVLYADIAYLNGPLSPYWNALCFRMFGPSVACLALSNAVIVAILIALLYRLMAIISDRRTAILCLLAFVLIFAFQHYMLNGNYNYIYPYSHETTHGITLAIGAIYCFWRYLNGERPVFAFLSGLLVGLSFLTKPETFLAAAAALGVGLLLFNAAQTDWRHRLTLWILCLAGGLVGPAVAFGLQARAMPLSQALEGTLGGFVYMLDPMVRAQPFYKTIMGTDHPHQSLATIARWVALYLAVFVPGFALALRVRGRGQWLWALAALGTVAALCYPWLRTVWLEALTPLPVWILAAAVLSFRSLVVHRGERAELPRRIVELMLFVFALVMLLRMLLNATVLWYGFTLAMPATLMLMVVMCHKIPAAINRRGGAGSVFAGAWLGAVIVFVGYCLYIDRGEFENKHVVVSGGGDTILANPVDGAAINEVLADISAHVATDQTLAVIPEGAMINYLSRRANPTPYNSFMPAELMVMFGEEPVLASFQARAPDYLIVTPRKLTEYGYQAFGVDYAKRLAPWLEQRYQAVTPASRTFRLYKRIDARQP